MAFTLTRLRLDGRQVVRTCSRNRPDGPACASEGGGLGRLEIQEGREALDQVGFILYFSRIPECGILPVIRSFADKKTEALFRDERVKEFQSIVRAAKRKLEMLDAASHLDDLKVPPGNRLEALSGDLSGFHSIRINDQWRLIFVWRDDGAYEVEIVDYH
jgi:proteic killer suppression protein